MAKSRRGKLYIDDAGWGPEAGSIKYGYRVPFGGIHVFIGKIGEPGPKPDICTDIIETAQRARPARVQPAMKRAFVGFTHGAELEHVSLHLLEPRLLPWQHGVEIHLHDLHPAHHARECHFFGLGLGIGSLDL